MNLDAFSANVIDWGLAVGPQLTHAIRIAIVENRIAPGVRLSEAELATHFGVSRQPIREAFIKLSEEGLLEVRPQRGTFVRKIEVASVLDARFVREAVEADIVGVCATSQPAGLVDELRQQIAAQQDMGEGHSTAFVPLDDLFHRTLAEGAGRPKAWDVIENMKSQMDRVRQLVATHRPFAPLIAQHIAVVDAIEAGDPRKAKGAMRGHLQMILSDLPAIQDSYPKYFEGPGPKP